ncbi:MAG: hypothetical protein E5X56_34180, partial [Mesorhizobium sp.]|uniref:hypothetical protein n=1 Tax=Mesorhizobium sp. TaxID=1871066 RepID=UPI00121C475B
MTIAMKLQKRAHGPDVGWYRTEFSQAEHAMSHATSYELFINGKWRAASNRATLPVINPATE